MIGLVDVIDHLKITGSGVRVIDVLEECLLNKEELMHVIDELRSCKWDVAS